MIMDINKKLPPDEGTKNNEDFADLASSVFDKLVAMAESDEEKVALAFYFYLWLNAYVHILKIIALSKYVKDKGTFIVKNMVILVKVYNGLYKFIKNLPSLSDLVLLGSDNPQEVISILEDMSKTDLSSLENLLDKESFVKTAIGPAAAVGGGSYLASISSGVVSKLLSLLIDTASAVGKDIIVPLGKTALINIPLKTGELLVKYGPSTIFYAGTAAFGLGMAASMLGWSIYKTWKDNVGVGTEKITSKGFTEKVNRDIAQLSNELLTKDLQRFKKELETQTSEIYGEDEFIPDVPPDVRKLKVVTFKRNIPQV
jgi:hypothetical protein